MANKEIKRLFKGFKKFKEEFFGRENSVYQKLNGWQGPKTLIIACSDSRVDPAILSSADPGDLFVVRNVANLVPPYNPDGARPGVSAAIEFAVVNLEVESIVVMGHRQCGGIKALLYPEESRAGGFVKKWMEIAESAKRDILKKYPDGTEEQLLRACEKEAIKTSLKNLMTFPFIKEAVNSQRMTLHGMLFDLEVGELFELDEQTGEFRKNS